MLDSDSIAKVKAGNRKVIIKYNKKYHTIKAGDIFFPSLTEAKIFVNKLSDVIEEIEEDTTDWFKGVEDDA